MRLLRRKASRDILLRICAMQIMVNEYVSDLEAIKKFTEHFAEISYAVGGLEGIKLVRDSINRWGGGE